MCVSLTKNLINFLLEIERLCHFKLNYNLLPQAIEVHHYQKYLLKTNRYLLFSEFIQIKILNHIY